MKKDQDEKKERDRHVKRDQDEKNERDRHVKRDHEKIVFFFADFMVFF